MLKLLAPGECGPLVGALSLLHCMQCLQQHTENKEGQERKKDGCRERREAKREEEKRRI